MIRHGIDLNEGLLFVFDDAHDVAMEFSFVLFWDEGLSAFDGEDDMYVDLCVCVWHVFPLCKNYTDAAPTGLDSYGMDAFYTDAAPTGLDSSVTWTFATQMPPLRGLTFFERRVLHRCRPYGA